jgi:hypothetical protein
VESATAVPTTAVAASTVPTAAGGCELAVANHERDDRQENCQVF